MPRGFCVRQQDLRAAVLCRVEALGRQAWGEVRKHGPGVEAAVLYVNAVGEATSGYGAGEVESLHRGEVVLRIVLGHKSIGINCGSQKFE